MSVNDFTVSIDNVSLSDSCEIKTSYDVKTLRDEIAIEAMKVLLSFLLPISGNEKQHYKAVNAVANTAYMLADQMIKARSENV